MNFKSQALAAAVAAAALSLGAAAQAQVIDTMNFVGVNPLTQTSNTILNYYNGGLSGVGTTGTNYGVAFGNDAVADSTLNSKTSVTGMPSGSTAALFFNYLASTNSNFTAYNTMNVAGGFTQLSFNYASEGAYNTTGADTTSANPATVSLYSGLNGTGSLLATITLGVNDYTGDGCAVGKVCKWSNSSTTLAAGQVAQSAVFSNASEYTYFDAVSLTTPTPEPATWGLMAAGLAAVGGALRLRRRA